jgi:hypothetical protein
VENQLTNEKDGIFWHQVVVGDRDNVLQRHKVLMRSDVDNVVGEFADFCKTVKGDLYNSIGTALNDINAQSKDLLNRVYRAEAESEIDNYEPLLDASVVLFKALDRYYARYCGEPRTGTTGD